MELVPVPHSGPLSSGSSVPLVLPGLRDQTLMSGPVFLAVGSRSHPLALPLHSGWQPSCCSTHGHSPLTRSRQPRDSGAVPSLVLLSQCPEPIWWGTRPSNQVLP